MTKQKYKPVQQKPNMRHKSKTDYNRKLEKSVNYDEFEENYMSLKSFEDYQVDHGQLFEARAAFEAAVAMCKVHYDTVIAEEDAVIVTEEAIKEFDEALQELADPNLAELDVSDLPD